MVVGCVHSTFRSIERAADWLTGRAGPYFVGVGFSLLLIGGSSFFLVMLPLRAPAPAPLASLFDTHSPLHVLLGIVPTFFACFQRNYVRETLVWLGAYGACTYILLMIAWAYLMACLEPAGNPVLGLGDNLKERRLGPGSGVWWARFRERAALASGPPLRMQGSAAAAAAATATATATGAAPSAPATGPQTPLIPDLDFEPASPIRINLRSSSDASTSISSRRGSGEMHLNGTSGSSTPARAAGAGAGAGAGASGTEQRRNSLARVGASLSTLLRPITGSSRAEYRAVPGEHDGDDGAVTGTGTAFLPRAPTPGASISGRKSAQGHRTRNGGAQDANGGKRGTAGSGSQGSRNGSSQIPMSAIPSKPGRTPDLEASLMPEPFTAVRPTALKQGSGSSSLGPTLVRPTPSAGGAAAGASFASHVTEEPYSIVATPTDQTRLVRPTPIYPDTTGDAFDLELDSEDLFPLPAKMCTKCKPIPLYVAIASLPPEMRKVEKMLRLGPGAASRSPAAMAAAAAAAAASGGPFDRNGSGTAGTPDAGRGKKSGGKGGKSKNKRNRARAGTANSSLNSPQGIGAGDLNLADILGAADADASEANGDFVSVLANGDSPAPSPIAGPGAGPGLAIPSRLLPPLPPPPRDDYIPHPHYVLQEPELDEDEGEADIRAWLGEEEAMRLVPPPKPERSHHCSVCNTCVTKYDHHCPWINACVGLGNERYFVLFLFWLSVGCATVVGTGYPLFPHIVRGWKTAFAGVKRSSGAKYRPFSAENDSPALRGYTGLDYNPPIDDRLGHHLEPSERGFASLSPFDGNLDFSLWTRVFLLLSLLVCSLMGFAVFIMLVWQLIMVGKGETTVESHDNGYYRKLARRRGQRFINVYDVGFFRNLALFFSLGPGSPHSLITIFLPLRIPPYSDGWHWAKRRGLGGRHAGIVPVEELTDDEGDLDDEPGSRRGSGASVRAPGGVPVPVLSVPSRSPPGPSPQGPSPVMAVLDESILTADL